MANQLARKVALELRVELVPRLASKLTPELASNKKAISVNSTNSCICNMLGR